MLLRGFFTILISLACTFHNLSAQEAEPQEAVFVADVIKGEFPQTQHVSGSLESYNAVTLKSESSGVVKKIHFHDGAYVDSGVLLFTLNDEEAKAELEKAQASLELAKAHFERKRTLHTKGFISDAEMDRAKADTKTAQGNLRIAKENLRKMHIHSPFDGILSQRRVSVGSSVNPQDALVDFHDLTPLRFSFDLPEKDMGKVEKDQKVTLVTDAYGERVFHGVVDSIEPAVNPKSRSIKIHARFENADMELKPGQFAHGTLYGQSMESGLSMPESALVYRQDGLHVFRLDSENAVSLVKVKTGSRAKDRVEILDGLKEGDTVVTRGQDKIYEGTVVDPHKE